MSYKSENWKEKLAEVRSYGTFTEHKDGSVEERANDLLNKEIEEELRLFEEEESQITEEEISEKEIVLDEEGMGDKLKKLFKLKNDKQVNGVANLMNMTSVKVLQSMQKQNPQGFLRMAEKLGELPAMEEVQPVKESVEKTIEKLTEKNMLGRLAKQLKLNEQGKEQLFNYFEKGELKQ